MRFGLLMLFAVWISVAFCEPADALVFKQQRSRQMTYSQTPLVKTVSTPTVVDDIEEEWLCLHLVNKELERRNIPPLEYCSILAEASCLWSSTMLRTGFRHGSGNEIIARGGLSGEFAHRIWMNSPPHRAALLNPRYTEVGFGMVNGFWTGRFR